MRKILFIILILAAVVSAAAVAYYGITYRPVSTILNEAINAESKGDSDEAERLLLQVVKKDPASEIGYKMLAQIYERKNNYTGATYYWERTAALNPLSSDYLEKLFDSAEAVGSDDYYIFKYEELSDTKKLSDKIKYGAGCAYLKKSQTRKCDDILAELEKSRSPYAMLLKAQISLRNRDTAAALKEFENTLSLAGGNADIMNSAKLGIAICELANGNNAKAREISDGIKTESAALKADVYILKSAIANGEGRQAEALENMIQARNIRRESVLIVLECAELALSQNKPEIITTIRKELGAYNKSAVMLDYYLSALENSAKGDDAKAYADIRLSGNLQQRPVAKILALELACRLKMPAEAAKAADELAAENIPSALKESVVAEMAALISDCENKGDFAGAQILSESLVKLAPENVKALAYTINSNLAKKNFSAALGNALKLDSINPGNASAYQAILISLDALNRNSETLKKAREYIKAHGQDAFSSLFAARAAAKLGDAKTAEEYYLYLLEDKELPEPILVEIGQFLDNAGSDGAFEKYFTTLSNDGNKAHAAMALTYKAKKLSARGEKDAARGLLKEAMGISPKSEAVYSEAAFLEYGDGKNDAAISVLENGLKEIPQSYELKSRLGLIKSESATAQNAGEIRALLESISPSRADAPYIYATLSNICALLKDSDAALAYAQKAAAADSSNPAALTELGLRLVERRQFDRAVSVLTRIKNISENSRAQTTLTAALEEAVKGTGAAYRKNLSLSVLKADPENKSAAKILSEAEKELAQIHEN